MEKTLSSEEIQNRWKNCVRVTCNVYRIVEGVIDFFNRVIEMINAFCDRLKEAFNGFINSLPSVIDSKKEVILTIKRCYPQSYTHSVDNSKVNTMGYPHHIYKCARSRC